MGNKDITQRRLLEHAEIAASIINVTGRLPFPVFPDELAYIPVHMLKQYGLKVRGQERDSYWLYTNRNNQELQILIGIENQSAEEYGMVFRELDYANSNRVQRMLEKKKPLLELNIVLYYGKRTWKGPRTLREAYGVDICRQFPALDPGDSVVVLDLGEMSEDHISSLFPDMQAVVEVVKANRFEKPYNVRELRLSFFMDTVRVICALLEIELTDELLAAFSGLKEEEQTMSQFYAFLSKEQYESATNKGRTHQRQDDLKVYNFLKRHNRVHEYGDALSSDSFFASLLSQAEAEERAYGS